MQFFAITAVTWVEPRQTFAVRSRASPILLVAHGIPCVLNAPEDTGQTPAARPV
jgi:hypothetical protein